MCTFCKTSELPSHEKGANSTKNKFISLFLKPNNENEQYRLRLLFFRQDKKNDRKDAYIVQKIHDHWGVSSKGTKIVDDFVICPGTDYVHYNDEKFILNPNTNKQELNCPICKKARENFSAYVSSGKTDKLSSQRGFQLKSKERLCAPVYVVNDPNNKNNSGRAMVLILTNPDDIKAFKKVVEDERAKSYQAAKEGNAYEVFNGVNAVDLYIRVETVPEVKNQGKSTEYVSNVRKITQIAFGKKPTNIPMINKELIDNLPFDDQFYFSNTKEELVDFYKKYYGQNDVTPDEEDVFGSTQTITQQPSNNQVNTENTTIAPSVEVNDDIDDIVGSTQNNVITETVVHQENDDADNNSDVLSNVMKDLDELGI